jgi:uncharacterized protein (DUF2147 family)
MRYGLAAFVILVTLVSVLRSASAQPQPAQEPSAVGLWQQIDPDSGKTQGWFLIFEHGGAYEGAIAKMFMKPEEDPNPTCTKCTGDQKNTPWLGLTIIKGMVRKGLEYEKGTILDPSAGNLWSALMHLSPDGQDLTVHGYVGLPVFGKDQNWKRLPDSDCSQIDPAVGVRLAFAVMRPGCLLPKPRAAK